MARVGVSLGGDIRAGCGIGLGKLGIGPGARSWVTAYRAKHLDQQVWSLRGFRHSGVLRTME